MIHWMNYVLYGMKCPVSLASFSILSSGMSQLSYEYAFLTSLRRNGPLKFFGNHQLYCSCPPLIVDNFTPKQTLFFSELQTCRLWKYQRAVTVDSSIPVVMELIV